MAKSVDASDLKSGIHIGCAGSTPASGTLLTFKYIIKMKTLSIRQQVLNVLPLYVLLFLIEENILRTYIDAVIKEEGTESAKYLSGIRDYWGSRNISGFLSASFLWENTPQGDEFWYQTAKKSLEYRYLFK